MNNTKLIKKMVIALATILSAPSFAQYNDIGNLFHKYEAEAATGIPCELTGIDPAIERLTQISNTEISKYCRKYFTLQAILTYASVVLLQSLYFR